jgi:glycosyltransferase involved in cell wall biosynthesis
MMVPLGYDVIHYGVEGADTAAQTHVNLMTRAEQTTLRGHDGSDPARFYGADGNVATPLYREFNRRLRVALERHVEPGDLVLLPFGHGHGDAVRGEPWTLVESGIGYPELYGAPFQIFESYAWMHWHQGRANRNGKNYEWVIPNYFDVDAWDVQLRPDPRTVVYMGRICAEKGLPTLVEIARRRPDLRFVLCGQGDPKPYLVAPNIEYLPPITGRDRSALLGSAAVVLMPTVFTEPFGGVAVEAMLCGSPVLSVGYGAFTETIEDEATGFRCHTMGDWLAALDRAPELDRAYIAARARRLYGYERVGRMYDRAFQAIADLRDEGWYSMRSPFLREAACAS